MVKHANVVSLQGNTGFPALWAGGGWKTANLAFIDTCTRNSAFPEEQGRQAQRTANLGIPRPKYTTFSVPYRNDVHYVKNIKFSVFSSNCSVFCVLGNGTVRKANAAYSAHSDRNTRYSSLCAHKMRKRIKTPYSRVGEPSFSFFGSRKAKTLKWGSLALFECK